MAIKYFVTAIHTDSGKTIASAILCEALKADYWKPVQAGSPYDSQVIRQLVQNATTRIHPEAYALKLPASPHAAAKNEGINIHLDSFHLPQSENLIVEGAGGALVPLNFSDLFLDLSSKFALPVILVSNYYLGSINHTLLTVEALQHRRVEITGIIFNGERNDQSREIILKRTGLKCLLDIDKEVQIDRAMIERYARKLNETGIR